MSKLIKLRQQDIEAVRADFEEALASGKFSDGKFTFSKELGKLDRKAKVYFEPMAWIKQSELVTKFDKEVAWHGVAERGEQPDTFIIKDILVYPQEVTGATVTTDQEKYQMWLMSHDDDVFNNIRYQGHSHVNMNTSPSSVDTNLYDNILQQLDDDMFYIFMIWNKRGEKHVKIYDLRENVFFESADVTISVLGMDGFYEAAKEMVVDKPVSYGYQKSYTTPSTPKKEEKKDEKKDNSGSYTRRGFRNPPNVTNQSSKSSVRGIYEEDDDYGYSSWFKDVYRY